MTDLNEGGFFQDQRNSSQEKKQPPTSLRPTTIKQILQASQLKQEDDTYHIDGVELGQFTIVGVVRNKIQTATHVSVHIEDGTGGLDIKRWSTATESENGFDDIETDCYIRAICEIKPYDKKKQVFALIMKRIKDPNEIFYHILDSLAVHLEFTNKDSNPQSIQASEISLLDNQLSAYNLNYKQIQVMKVLHAPNVPVEGYQSKKISELTKIDMATVSGILDNLLDNGVVYTTIDEFHFASSLINNM